MSNFNRAYRLLIGDPYFVSFSPTPDQQLRASQIENFYRSAESSGRVYSQHQIEFEIKKGHTSRSAVSSITVYNLDNDSVDYLSQNRDKNLAVKFEAGYTGNLKTLFKGTIDKIEDVRDSQDRRTRLVLGESTVNKKEAVSLRTYPRGSNVNQIVKDLVGDLGVAEGNIQPIVGNNITYPLKKTVQGHTETLLSNIATWYGYRFSIQNGEAYFVPENAKFVETVAVISGSTGLVGDPEPISDTNKVSVESKLPKLGFKVKTLLDASIQPETTILLQSKDINDTFKVSKATYRGDFRGNDWYCNFECKKVDRVII